MVRLVEGLLDGVCLERTETDPAARFEGIKSQVLEFIQVAQGVQPLSRTGIHFLLPANTDR